MTEHISMHVGLDVHKASTAIAVAERDRQARFIGTVGAEPGELRKVLKRLGTAESLQIVYEAGPCGYGLVRSLRARGYRCEVIAPAKVARRPGDRVKTDRRDALHLAEQSRAGALTAVWVLEEADEAIRDLSRAHPSPIARFLTCPLCAQRILLTRKYSPYSARSKNSLCALIAAREFHESVTDAG